MLTPAQLEARKGRLTASRVGCLMRSEADNMMRLWREMTGQEQEEDLSRVWHVWFGGRTEEDQLDWFELENNMPVTRRGEVVVHPLHDCFAATLDGWIDFPARPIECKHTEHNTPVEVIIERYQPQLHWQMECCGVTHAVLSIIRGRDKPILEEIEMDHAYADELMRRGLRFMECVRKRVSPVILPPVPAPVSKWIDYNMIGNETWERYAKTWLQTKGAAESCDEASKVLKSMVPADARKCFGYGARITRDRAGRLSLRIDHE